MWDAVVGVRVLGMWHMGCDFLKKNYHLKGRANARNMQEMLRQHVAGVLSSFRHSCNSVAMVTFCLDMFTLLPATNVPATMLCSFRQTLQQCCVRFAKHCNNVVFVSPHIATMLRSFRQTLQQCCVRFASYCNNIVFVSPDIATILCSYRQTLLQYCVRFARQCNNVVCFVQPFSFEGDDFRIFKYSIKIKTNTFPTWFKILCGF